MNIQIFFEDSVGNEFQVEFAHSVKMHFVKNGSADSIEIHIDDDIDVLEGTDAIIEGIRVDFTTAFYAKDNMVAYESESIFIKYGDIKFGIRTGNSHHGFTKFDVPVVVVGLDCANSFYKTYVDQIHKTIESKMEEILDTISDVFWGYCDNMGLEF